MEWKDYIRAEIEYTFSVTEKLIDMVSPAMLDWKPETGSNWMTMGQLLQHITNACGSGIKGFATGDWGIPPEAMENMDTEDMLPPASKLPTAESITKVKELLKEDEKMALEILDKCSEERLANEIAKAPWDQLEPVLGQRLMQMVDHLKQHKGQLFYYLKLQNKPVNTGHLWGM
jgi:uncharacterized damage-inducible protein DinB